MMEATRYNEELSKRERGHHQHHHKNCPSFSSTLLDSIYRSMDETREGSLADHVPHPQQPRQREQLLIQEDITSLQQGSAWKGHDPKIGIGHERTIVIEDLKVKKGNRKETSIHWHSMADLQSPKSLWNYSSSSSDSSSSKGGFLSSESSDYFIRGEGKSRSSASCNSMKKLKPIRTSISVDLPERTRIIDSLHEDNDLQVNNKQGVAKAKSKASKIYDELKRVSGNNSKHPISPGSKLASFLNALFNAKKAKISSGYDEGFLGRVPKSSYPSTCSSTSSFSRSCLSKTPSSRGKSSDDRTKRSVKFCPVSVIIENDFRPCQQKSVMLSDQDLIPKRPVKANEAETILRNYVKTRQNQASFDIEDQEEDDGNDDDGASCASSDLFELENFSGVEINGIGGYRFSEELPVYETTKLDTNRAIANRLIA